MPAVPGVAAGGADRRLAAQRQAELGHRGLAEDGEAGRLETRGRITSYNVCYTKLLRLVQVLEGIGRVERDLPEDVALAWRGPSRDGELPT